MTLLNHLVEIADQYCAARGVSRSWLGEKVFHNTRRFDEFAAGSADLKTATFERALQWFSDNWPGDLAWPDGPYPRPVPRANTETDPAPRANTETDPAQRANSKSDPDPRANSDPAPRAGQPKGKAA